MTDKIKVGKRKYKVKLDTKDYLVYCYKIFPSLDMYGNQITKKGFCKHIFGPFTSCEHCSLYKELKLLKIEGVIK